MKRVLTGIMTMVLAASLCAATAFAAGPGCGRYFVDADGDGICDNASSRCAYVDANGDGICDNCGIHHWGHRAGTGSGSFVDADGDGLCDVCGVAHARYGGGNFVDADGDGVCDNFQSGQGRGCGYGRGGQGGRGHGCHSGRNQ